MQQPEQRPFLEAALRERLRQIDATADAGNGTPLADAAASVLAYDLAASAGTLARLRRTGDAKLARGMRQIEALIARGDEARELLPWGTEAWGHSAGRIGLPDTELVLVAGRPGMHEHVSGIETTGVHGRLLVREINAELARVGVPQMIMEETATFPDCLANRQEVRFGPQPAAGGTALAVSLTHGEIEFMTTGAVISLAHSAAAAAHAYWLRRDEVSQQAEALAAKVEALLDELRQGAAPLRLLGIVARMTDFNTGILYYGATVEALCENLQMRAIAYSNHDADRLIGDFRKRLRNQPALAARWLQARDAGAVGFVDAPVLRVLDAAGLDLPEVIATIEELGFIHVQAVLPSGLPVEGEVRWRAGSLIAWPLRFAGAWLEGSVLRLPDTRLPETLVNTLPDRPVGALIEDPFLDGAAIASAETDDTGCLWVSLSMPSWPVGADRRAVRA